MPVRWLARRAVVVALLCLCLLWEQASAAPPSELYDLDIFTERGVERFEVELADTDAERARGLMHREHLGARRGMLFVYPNDRIASFWMKNTLIPLDMLFVAPDGTIRGLHEMAEPLSLTPIRSEVPVRAVLEINGGLARTLGIAPGDRVRVYLKGRSTGE